MSGTRIAVALLGCVAACSQNTKAADNPDLVLSRQEIRRQLSLHNGLMRDALKKNSAPSKTQGHRGDFRLNASRQRYSFRSMTSYPLFSASRNNGSCRRWNWPASTSGWRSGCATGDQKIVRHPQCWQQNLRSKATRLKRCSSFSDRQPGSSLAQDLRDESKAYLRLRTITEHLSSPKTSVIKKKRLCSTYVITFIRLRRTFYSSGGFPRCCLEFCLRHRHPHLLLSKANTDRGIRTPTSVSDPSTQPA